MLQEDKLKRLCEHLDKIEATPGKKDTAALLEQLRDGDLNQIAQEFLSIAMDWYRIYGLGEKSLEQMILSRGHPDILAHGPWDEQVGVWGDSQLTHKNGTWEGFKKMVSELEGKKGSQNSEMKTKIADQVWSYPLEVGKWLQRALLKNLRAGFSEKTVNKVWPKLINFFEVQLADSLDDVAALKLPEEAPTHKADGDYFFLEPKLDGVRAICRVIPEKKSVQFFSRGGQPLYNTNLAGIDAELLKTCTGDVVFDGELFCHNFNDTMKVVSKEEDADPALIKDLRFYVFDMLSGKEWDNQKCELTFYERRLGLAFGVMNKDASANSSLICKTRCHAVNNMKLFRELNQTYLNLGLEGVMVKEPQGLYEFKRTRAWLKYKPLETHDFKIIGVVEGNKTKKYKGKVGALLLDLGDGLTCECGSGLDDQQRTEWMASPPTGVYAEIEFKMKTPDGLLREPVFVRLRPDKKDVAS